MKQLLIELEDELAEKLEAVAPARERKRSQFVRMAIRKAIWDLEEQGVAAAYARQPVVAGEEWIDPEVWDRPAAPRPRRRRR